jgi:hypothetical protein
MIKRKDGKYSLITNVLYVPCTKSNLLSLGQILEKRSKMMMNDKILNIMDNNQKMIVKYPLTKNIIFKFEVQVMEHKCLSTTIRIDEWT